MNPGILAAHRGVVLCEFDRSWKMFSARKQIQPASAGSEHLVRPSSLSVPTRGEEKYPPSKLFLLST